MSPQDYSNLPDLFTDEPRPEVKSPTIEVKKQPKRGVILDKIPLGEFLLGPQAIRGYGTGLGAAGGGILGSSAAGVGAIPGMAFGGYVGNRLTNEAQTWLPGILGEPSEDGKTTAAVDSLANLLGLGIGKAIPKVASLATKNGRERLAAKLLSKMGETPENQLTTSALNPEFQTNLGKPIRELHQMGMPMTGGQVKGSPLALELEKTASTHIPIVKEQNVFIQNMAKDILSQKTLNAKERGQMFRWGIGETAEWLRATSPRVSEILAPDQSSEAWLKASLSDLPNYKAFTEVVGPTKAQTVLFKETLAKSLNAEGTFDPLKLYSGMRNKMDMFNYIAKETERAGLGKASDLKASWNRFIYANLLASRGKSVSNKALEIAATQAGVTGLIALPLLGLGSYPAWRAIATGGKIALVGPSLGKAFSNPKVVEIMTRLSTNSSNNPANKSAFRELAKWAWQNGVAFQTTKGADYMINPKTFEPIAVPNYQMPTNDTPDLYH